MIVAVVPLRGIRVRVAPDYTGQDAACAVCVFKGHSGCPTADEERAAGIVPCYDGGHHYIEEEEDAQA